MSESRGFYRPTAEGSQEERLDMLNQAMRFLWLVPLFSAIGLGGTLVALNPLGWVAGTVLSVVLALLFGYWPTRICRMVGRAAGWTVFWSTALGVLLGVITVFLWGVVSTPLLYWLVVGQRRKLLETG